MNILVDGRTLCRYAAGITSVLHNALVEWAGQKPADMFYVLLPKKIDSRIDTEAYPGNVKLLEYDSKLTRRLPNIIILQWLVPRLCRKLNIDIYFSPVPHLPFMIGRGTKTIVVAHDVVNIEYQQTMSMTNRLANKYFFGYAIRNADFLWYNSEYTRSKIEHYFPQRKCKDGIVGISTDDACYNANEPRASILSDLRAKYAFQHRYVLFVGSLEPRKNLACLIKMAPKLYSQHGLQLVVVGANKWKDSDISQIVNAEGFLREAVVFCGYVSNEELAALYHGARCLVSTSLNEGFGLPQLEALKCGCPIVTANNSAMAELAKGKEGAVAVDGYDEQTWLDAISKTAVNRPSVNHEQLSSYNWQSIIARLIEYINYRTHLK